MAIIALAGVVVRNGILLVEFTDMLIEQGQNLHDAVVEAARTRMTPVLLTATAAIMGLIPLALGFNIDFAGLFTLVEPHIYFGGDNNAFLGAIILDDDLRLRFCHDYHADTGALYVHYPCQNEK